MLPPHRWGNRVCGKCTKDQSPVLSLLQLPAARVRPNSCPPCTSTTTWLLKTGPRLGVKTQEARSQVPQRDLCGLVTWGKSLPSLGLTFPFCVMGCWMVRSSQPCQLFQNSAASTKALPV